MFKILLISFLVFIIYIYVKRKKRHNEIDKNLVDLVKDPCCDVYVDKDTPFKVKYYDNIYYFCSKACRTKFIKSKENKES